jgi:hypothetical protein
VRVGEQSLTHDHVYPLWNPYVFLGMPSFASGGYNPWIYPPDWPVAILQKVLPLPELTWLLLYYFLGGFFLFLLAREWGARPEGALLAAVAFVFAPNLVAVGSHGHGSQLVNSAYLPLLLWLATRWMRNGRLSDLALLGIAGGFQLLRGHVQICFYSWMAVGLYALVETLAAARDPKRIGATLARAVAVGGAAAIAFGIAAFYNLPLRDYAQWSIRGSGAGGGVAVDYATAWSLGPWELPSIVVPGWAGFGGATYWGGMPFTDYPNAFVGMVTVALALLAFAAPAAAPRLKAFALALAAFSLLVAFGKYTPFYGFLYEHLPLFNKFRVPVMIVILFQLAACLGLAWGWTTALDAARLPAERRKLVERVLLGGGIALAVLFVAGVMGQGMWREGYIARALSIRGAEGYSAEAASLAYRGYVSDLARACLYGLAAIGLAFLAMRGTVAATLTTAGVLALIGIELFPMSHRLMEPVIGDPLQRNLDIGRDDIVDFLEKAGPPGTFRILPVEQSDFQNNRYSGFAIASLGGYHAAKPQLIQDFLDAQLAFNYGWMRLLNIRYLVTRQPLEGLPPFLKEVHRGTGVVYENLLALPRATVVDRYRVVTPAKAILDSVKNAEDSAPLTYLEKEPGTAIGPAPDATARITSYRLNDVTIDVDNPGPGAGLLRLADAWYPDWKATVNGRPAEVLKADYLLRAVVVPPGKHTVVFRFDSSPMRTGLAISLASLGAALALLVVDLLARRRARIPTPAAEAAPGAVA